jgi:rhamnogalacturonan II specific xylosyltransferase
LALVTTGHAVLMHTVWICLTQVDVYLLPQVAFPSGGLYFKNETWRKEMANKHVIVHNNYVVGFDQKTKRFRDHNLWFVEVDAQLSPLSEKGG